MKRLASATSFPGHTLSVAELDIFERLKAKHRPTTEAKDVIGGVLLWVRADKAFGVELEWIGIYGTVARHIPEGPMSTK